MRDELDLAVRNDVNVLIIGETGTGKEYIANYLHELQKQQSGGILLNTPFIPVNCGAIPEALAESILFGHERGSFTSARERQLGKFELARNGTLFLDEIQALPLTTQVKLLRVLQHREVERLGSKGTQPIHCKVIASTNVPLELLIEQKKFRRDLYFRLNVCPIYLPSLRHRKEDLPTLIEGLLEKLRKKHRFQVHDMSAEVFECLLNYDWPGNIRELEHCLLYASLRSSKKIEMKDLPHSVTGQLQRYLTEGTWDLFL